MFLGILCILFSASHFFNNPLKIAMSGFSMPPNSEDRMIFLSGEKIEPAPINISSKGKEKAYPRGHSNLRKTEPWEGSNF